MADGSAKAISQVRVGDRVAAEVAPLWAALEAGKAAGEIRFSLQADNPGIHGWT